MKNEYELWAIEQQSNTLSKKCSFHHCIVWLRRNTFTLSEERMDAQIELVASIFGLTKEQVKGAIEEKEIWLYKV